MKRDTREALTAYYKEADSWAADRSAELRRSHRIAWIIACVAVVIAALEAIAIVTLTPLKTVVPYTLMVDRTTGFVQQLKPLEANQIAPDAALTQSFLVQYVIARESFDIDTVQSNYRQVGLWSADAARSEYLSQMQVSNPDSPLVRLPRSSVLETRVKSVSPLGRQAALVRFESVRKDAGGQQQPPRAWVAVLRYRFSGEPASVADRYLNPLGFQVVRYRKDEEALPASAPVGAASSAPSGFAPTAVSAAVNGQTAIGPGRQP